MSEYDIEFIKQLLDEIKENYHEIMLKLDEMGDDNLENVLDGEYKKIIDTIRGIRI